MKLFKGTAIAALGLFLAAEPSSAATENCFVDLNGPNDITYSVSHATSSFCETGALNEGQGGQVSFMNMTYELGISDSGASTLGSPLSWGVDPMTTQGGSGPKAWGISLASGWMGQVLLQLKQANSYALFDVTSSCDFNTSSCVGTWSNVKGNSTNGLSNTRAYYKTSVNVVPLPAAGGMLLAALGGLIAMRRRKS